MFSLCSGNMVDTRTKSVLTWRVAEENNGKSKKWINETILGAAKKGFKTCFLPNKPRKDDTTGEVPPVERMFALPSLSFNNHVQLKCKKANSKLLALKRLSSFLTEECRLAILRSFVVSHFIYCSPLFHFTNKYFQTKQEKVLYRGLRFDSI